MTTLEEHMMLVKQIEAESAALARLNVAVPTAGTVQRFALGLIKFDPSQDDATYDALPGRCVFGYVDYDQASPLLVTREPAPPKPRFCALIEAQLPKGDEQPAPVQRRFISVKYGQIIDWPGELKHFWTFVNPQTGAVRAIYEVISFDELEAKRRVEAAAAALEAATPAPR